MHRTLIRLIAAAGLALAAGAAQAQFARNPDGVNVNSTGPTTLAIRFFSGAATGNFTTTNAIFCAIDPNLATGGIGPNPCPASQIIGRLPATLDRGSTTEPTSRITDFMTIPYSVSRRALVRARAGEQSDFFYIREMNVGGLLTFVAVTCRMTGGTARSPLSLTRVDIYGDEPDARDRVRQVRVSNENVDTGVIKAEISYTGVGILTGWWEVRTPVDPPIRDIDRFTEASLSEQQRLQQRQFRRIKRFRLQVPPTGQLTLVGPRYDELPREIHGQHEILLRVESVRDREQLSSLAVPGESTMLFSGAAAGFPLPTLDYLITEAIGAASLGLSPRVIVDKAADGVTDQVAVVWESGAVTGPIMQVEIFDPATGQSYKALAPAESGIFVLPQNLVQGVDIAALQIGITLIGRDRQPMSEPMAVSVQ